MNDDLGRELRSIDAALGRIPLPPELEARILRGEPEPSPHPEPSPGPEPSPPPEPSAPPEASGGSAAPVLAGPWRMLASALVGAAAAAALVAWWMSARPVETPAPRTPLADAGGPASPRSPAALTRPPAPDLADRFVVEGDACDPAVSDGTVRVAAGCRLTLESPSIELETYADTELRATPRGVSLRQGRVFFHVIPVAAGAPPVQVELPHGHIDVLGTRFVVALDDAGGSIDLLDGAIRFSDEAGETDVEVGQRHRFGTAASAITDPKPPPPATKPTPVEPPSPTPAVELDNVLRTATRLRHAGRYAEAVETLREGEAAAKTPRAREVLSFEQGTLLGKFAAPDRVCRHWARHLRRFPDGGYAEEVAEQRRQTGCEGDP